MHYFFKHSVLYSGAYFIQTKCISKMITERSTRIVNFMTSVAGGFVLGKDHLSLIGENAIFLLLFLSTLGHQTK